MMVYDSGAAGDGPGGLEAWRQVGLDGVTLGAPDTLEAGGWLYVAALSDTPPWRRVADAGGWTFAVRFEAPVLWDDRRLIGWRRLFGTGAGSAPDAARAALEYSPGVPVEPVSRDVLAVALGVSAVTEVAALDAARSAAAELVLARAPCAPATVLRSAVLRVASYIYDRPESGQVWMASGAGALLAEWTGEV